MTNLVNDPKSQAIQQGVAQKLEDMSQKRIDHVMNVIMEFAFPAYNQALAGIYNGMLEDHGVTMGEANAAMNYVVERYRIQGELNGTIRADVRIDNEAQVIKQEATKQKIMM